MPVSCGIPVCASLRNEVLREQKIESLFVTFVCLLEQLFNKGLNRVCGLLSLYIAIVVLFSLLTIIGPLFRLSIVDVLARTRVYDILMSPHCDQRGTNLTHLMHMSITCMNRSFIRSNFYANLPSM
jgi:hypothetical protein